MNNHKRESTSFIVRMPEYRLLGGDQTLSHSYPDQHSNFADIPNEAHTGTNYRVRDSD